MQTLFARANRAQCYSRFNDENNIDYTVFTKPWRDKSLGDLGKFVRGLGFTGVELPVRPGFQVEPENVERDLPEAARILREEGVKIGTLAGPTAEYSAHDAVDRLIVEDIAFAKSLFGEEA